MIRGGPAGRPKRSRATKIDRRRPPKAVQEPTVQIAGPIFEQFRRVGNAPRIGSDEAQSTSVKIDVFASVTHLSWVLLLPTAPRSALGLDLCVLLGTLGCSWDACAASHWRPRAFLCSILKCFGVIVEPVKARRTHNFCMRICLHSCRHKGTASLGLPPFTHNSQLFLWRSRLHLLDNCSAVIDSRSVGDLLPLLRLL